MREHHPMRYNRMTEILKMVSRTKSGFDNSVYRKFGESNIDRSKFSINWLQNLSKLSPSFLLKSYFLKSPATVLMVTYFFMVFIVGYIVFALERSNGTCMLYQDVLWIMVVTITNLGYGDFTPSYWISRSIIAFMSVFGIFQTALIVGVLRPVFSFFRRRTVYNPCDMNYIIPIMGHIGMGHIDIDLVKNSAKWSFGYSFRWKENLRTNGKKSSG